MTLWTAKEVLQATGGTCPSKHWQASGVSIDTRTLEKGDLFIALPGVRFDANAFVKDAYKKGASGAIVSKVDTEVPLPQVYVKDTGKSLDSLAHFARGRLRGQVIGITGSVGKTSIKNSLAFILSHYGKTHATRGNFNNHYGVPLTLCNAPKDTKYSVVEMGMSHRGEIQSLTTLVRPHIALVSAVDVAHLAFFANIEGIALAKAEIFEGLSPDGTAIYNGDTNCVEILRKEAGQYAKRVFTYGKGKDSTLQIADVHVDNMQQTVTVKGWNQTFSFPLTMLGHHRVYNALATLLCLHTLSIDIKRASRLLTEIQPTKGRGTLSVCTVNGRKVLLYDDSYNGAPSSVVACLQTLAQTPTQGRRIAVLGDMLELGTNTIAIHKALKESMEKYHIHKLYACGNSMKALYDSLPVKHKGAWAGQSTALCPLVLESLQEGDTVVVKGSLGSNMQHIVNSIRGQI